MFSLADIRRFKRMQKEYRKLSGMGTIVATGFGPGGAIPYSRKTVGRLWWEVGASGENPAQGVEEFWSILRERFPRTYDQMHNWLSSNGWNFLYHDPFGDVPSRLATIDVVEAFATHPLEPGSLYGLGEHYPFDMVFNSEREAGEYAQGVIRYAASKGQNIDPLVQEMTDGTFRVFLDDDQPFSLDPEYRARGWSRGAPFDMRPYLRTESGPSMVPIKPWEKGVAGGSLYGLGEEVLLSWDQYYDEPQGLEPLLELIHARAFLIEQKDAEDIAAMCRNRWEFGGREAFEAGVMSWPNYQEAWEECVDSGIHLKEEIKSPAIWAKFVNPESEYWIKGPGHRGRD